MIKAYEIIEKYYPKDSDVYYILLIHSEQVKDKAIEIANLNPDLQLDRNFLIEASLLHDIGIFLCNAPRIHCTGNRPYIEHGYLGAELLRGLGLQKHARVCERHTGTGISKDLIEKNKLQIPAMNYFPETLEEQVICFADKFYSKTRLHEPNSIEHIRKDLARYGESQVAKFDAWNQKFS
ncbi:MAG: phosphohydrolase [Porphyromonadaceae bacterium CG2_30_38_12]|nr:MAG: phosphohydrolase [Porphyromonadaceae bacterium CG2_30_38_12]